MVTRAYFALFAALLFPHTALAVLPPDIIFSLGTQLWQIAVGILALIVGSITALFPFLKGATANIPRLRVIMLSLGMCLLLSGFGYLVFIAATDTGTEVGAVSQSASTTGYEFHGNRFVFLGTLASGDDVLINIDVYRKERSLGLFTHYYLGDVVNGTSSTPIDVVRDATTSAVLPDLFFSQFARMLPEDHSAREAYALSFVSGGHAYSIETDMITSDFLIKNEPEYTAYIGAGKARGVVDGESVVFYTMIERIYSTNYRPTIFFDPDGKVKSETIQLVLWDAEENFYLADQSRVDEFTPGYASHFWGLIKSAGGASRRIFAGSAERSNSGGSVHFTAQFLAEGRQDGLLTAQLVKPFAGEDDEGYVEGSVTDAGQERSVRGFGYHHRYGPN